MLTEDRPDAQPTALEQLAADPHSRSKFLKMVGGAGAAGALSILLAACGDDDKKTSSKKSTTKMKSDTDSTMSDTSSTMTSTTSSTSSGDIDIVNYALTLEYLEADFYSKVVASGLFKGADLDLIKHFGDSEQQHVDALKATVTKLGGTPVEAPQAKFPLDDAMSVLKLAATVENLGAAAYLGAAGMIESPEILAAALSIHSVEARHASTLNSKLGMSITPDGAFAKGADKATVLAAVKPFLVA